MPYTGQVANATVRQTTPAVVQSAILFERDGSASLHTWQVLTLSRITIGLLGHRSDRPVNQSISQSINQYKSAYTKPWSALHNETTFHLAEGDQL